MTSANASICSGVMPPKGSLIRIICTPGWRWPYTPCLRRNPMNSFSGVSPSRNFVASVSKSSNSRSRIGMMCPGTSLRTSGFSREPCRPAGRLPWRADGSMMGLRKGAGRPSERTNIPKARSATRDLTLRRGSDALEGVPPALELRPLDGVRAERDGPLVGRGRGVRVARAAQQVRACGMEGLVPAEAAIRRKLVEDGESGPRAACHADRDRPIDVDDRRGRPPRELAVEPGDLPPVGLLGAPGGRVERCDRGLELVRPGAPEP